MSTHYEIKILKPSEVTQLLIKQLVGLIVEGGQIEKQFAEAGLKRANCIGIMLVGQEIITSCTIKNPNDGYRTGVFAHAGSQLLATNYQYELGYIVTNSKYEGQGFCQKLLSHLMPIVTNQSIFATTRKPSMAHILNKNGFLKEGHTFKDDLSLFIRN